MTAVTAESLDLYEHGNYGGVLLIRYRVEDISDCCSVLGSADDHSLEEVATAMTGVLASPAAPKLLLASRPPQLISRTTSEATALASLETLIVRLRERSEVTEADTEKEEGCFEEDPALGALAHFSRGILIYVLENSSGGDPVSVSVAWLRSFQKLFLEASPERSFRRAMSEARIFRFVESAQIRAEDLQPVDQHGHSLAAGTSSFTQGTHRNSTSFPSACILAIRPYGWVWRARDRGTGLMYAVKTIRSQRRPLQDFAIRECAAAFRLRAKPHPCIVRLWHLYFEERTDVNCSLVMEYCPGETLARQILNRRATALRQESSYEPPKYSIRWLGQIFLALEHLHLQLNTMVMEMRPENVILTEAGHAKLTGFAFSQLGEALEATQTFGVPTGCSAYMAPEVTACSGYDYRADLYSFGVLVWVMLSGGVVDEAESLSPPVNQGFTLSDKQNWQLLEDCVLHPAPGLPLVQNEEARDLIVRLVHRGDRIPLPTHADVRSHSMLAELCLPDAAAGWGACCAWLDAGCTEAPFTFSVV